MRVLVVSDIHANPAALDAVRAAAGPVDAALCLGDLVEYGPCPGPCVAWARDHALVTVRGNHDHGAAHGVDGGGVSGFKYLTCVTRAATVAQLRPADRGYLARLPVTKMLRLGGKSFFLVHASPRDPLDEYVPPDAESWAARLGGVSADFVLVGHTHTPMQLTVGGTTVVNPGSVGLPRDGNPRARYAVITDGVVELKEVEYDIARTVAAVRGGPLDPCAKQMLADVFTHGRYVHPPGLPVPPGTANGHANGRAGRGYTPVSLPAAE